MDTAKYSAARERSVGLGAMGFHSYLQNNGLPFESALARAANLRMFKHLRREADAASRVLAEERGACPDAAERGATERFSHKLAIAPTASISVICGGTSACIEPIPANIYTHKTLSGSFSVRNPALAKVLDAKGLNVEETWQSILAHEGSVQHLEGLSDDEKSVFRTAFEIDQRWVIELAADRAPLVCQGQSLNLYLRSDIHKWDLLMLHWTAWERGVKSLYYCRSKSVQRAGFAGVGADNTRVIAVNPPSNEGNLDVIPPEDLLASVQSTAAEAQKAGLFTSDDQLEHARRQLSWWYILLVAIVAAVVEIYIANKSYRPSSGTLIPAKGTGSGLFGIGRNG
jgi:ribonucleoside-diphosphate reductase alpha chain